MRGCDRASREGGAAGVPCPRKDHGAIGNRPFPLQPLSHAHPWEASLWWLDDGPPEGRAEPRQAAWAAQPWARHDGGWTIFLLPRDGKEAAFPCSLHLWPSTLSPPPPQLPCLPSSSPSVSLAGRVFRTSPVAPPGSDFSLFIWLSRAWGGTPGTEGSSRSGKRTSPLQQISLSPHPSFSASCHCPEHQS